MRRSQALALHIVLHHIESHPADAALWLDTTGHLAPACLATFASHSVRCGTIHVFLPSLVLMHAWNVQPTYKELLTRLNIASTFDTAKARRTIEALDAQGDASGKPGSRPSQFRIVVLDTVTALLAPQLSGISSQGNVIATTLHLPTSAQLVCPVQHRVPCIG